MFRFAVLVSLVALVAAAPQLRAADDEYDPNPQYQYSYQVQDPVTGDSKSASESRQGDSVQGSYSLLEADGSTRTVEYSADPASGFQAVVKKDGQPAGQSAPAPAPAARYGAAPAAPSARYVAAPAARYLAAPQQVYYRPAPRYYQGGPALSSASFNAPNYSYGY